MNEKTRLNIFASQTENVRLLEKAFKRTNRSLNVNIRRGNHLEVEIDTKILTLLYCSWSEAYFSKLIHTPAGFNLQEIEQIKKCGKGNIATGWEKCLELAMRKAKANGKSNFFPNARQKLKSAIKTNVIDLSRFRNKFAHGQMSIALTRDNTAIDQELSLQIKNLDPVQIYRWKTAQTYILQIIEHLIESPKKHFIKSYITNLAELDQFLIQTKNWTLQTKFQTLQLKKRP